MLDFINQNGPIKFFVAFAIVLALIGLTAWLVRRFSANRLGGNTRGRQPRLAVIDAASVDGRRRLVLIRRDNVEHLMMIGGPNDLLVEPNIVRATAGRDTLRSAPPEARQDMRQDIRSAPVVETNGGAMNGNWPLQPSIEPPLSVPPQPAAPRSYRAPVTDEPWVQPESSAREPAARARPSDSIAGMAAEFNARLNPEFDIPPAPPRPAAAAPPPPPMPAPMREPVAVAPPPAATAPQLPPNTDRNLAEMAQRLEAALRRPNTKDDIHPPAAEPLASPRAEPKLDFAPEVKPEPKFEMNEPKTDVKPVQASAAKNPFDSLEEEMASLLGRQPGKT